MTSAYCREIILLGKTGNGKSSLGNSLLGKTAFQVEQSLNSVTQQCQKDSNSIISVVDTPGLFDSEIDEADVASEIHSALDKCPRPHAFIVVFSALGRMTQDELETIKLMRDIFNENCLRHTIVVFTGYDEERSDREFAEFWRSNSIMQEFVEACDGRIARIDNSGTVESKSKRVDEIVRCVDVLTENGKHRFDRSFNLLDKDVLRKQKTKDTFSKKAANTDPRHFRRAINETHANKNTSLSRITRPAFAYCREIIILGKTGSGISSLGNSLLGKFVFQTRRSLTSTTQTCQRESNNKISVTDTPGLFSGETYFVDTALEILNALKVCPNPHAFIVALSALSRMTCDDINTIHSLPHILSERCFKHIIVVFTRCNDSEISDSNFETYFRSNLLLHNFVEQCGGRVARIDNNDSFDKRSKRVKEIIRLVDNLSENGSRRFDSSFKTHQEYVFRKLQERNAVRDIARRRWQNHYEEEIKEISDALKKGYSLPETSQCQII